MGFHNNQKGQGGSQKNSRRAQLVSAKVRVMLSFHFGKKCVEISPVESRPTAIQTAHGKKKTKRSSLRNDLIEHHKNTGV